MPSHCKLSRWGHIAGFSSQNCLVRLLGYTRVSTSGQDSQLQLDALVATGVQKRDVFTDVTSGSKTAIERPGMKKLLEYAEEGDTVVVWRVDRLGRSLIDVLNTVALLRGRGVQVRSISDGIDPATSTGRLMLNMLATLAEYERELIIERVNAGIAAARQSGTRFGRPLSDPAVIPTNLRSLRTPARRDAPPKTPPVSLAGAAQRFTGTSKLMPHARADNLAWHAALLVDAGLLQGPRFARAVDAFFCFLLLSCGSYVPAPPAQPSCGRLRSRWLVSALRLFPPTTHRLLALRVAPVPSGTATRCSASRQKTPGGEGKLAGHQGRPTHRILSKGREKP